MKKIQILILIAAVFFSCDERYEKGRYPEIVTNLSTVNSEYDDYNSKLEVSPGGFFLTFSTNRHSKGNDFDFIKYYVNINWYPKKRHLEMKTEKMESQILNFVNTPNNELGPYSLDISHILLLYANNDSGDYDLKYVSNNTIYNIAFLNTKANEMYPSFYGNGVYTRCRNTNENEHFVNKIEKIIYCSDKDNSFDIYEVSVPKNTNILKILSSNEARQSVKLPINSDYDDKCPFMNGNILVFSSNRPGGYGGFDLYFCIYQNGVWSNPVNFGEKINTPYDEYRPITHYEYSYDNNLLVFSSNRPGGLGGFDLYYVGIPKSIKIQ
ncbi:MAG: hypothetical protein WCZ21_06485 [Bacteroidales bacterium]